MPQGYVYVLENSSMPGLIKIGKTGRDPKLRAMELSRQTGVPTPYKVAYEIYSDDYGLLEKSVHFDLSDKKHNKEFFKATPAEAITVIEKIAMPVQGYSDKLMAIRIMSQLETRYPSWLREEISDIRIVQGSDNVWLEITIEQEIAGYLVDQKIHRSDLAFISEDIGDGKFFSPQTAISGNAIRFLNEFDPYSIIHTTDLFNDHACKEIAADPKYNPHIRQG